MERIKKSWIREYPLLRLYRQDVEEIVNLFKSNYEKFEIIADRFKLNDFSEVDEIKKNVITNFSINAYDPYLSLELSNSRATLYISDEENIKLRGLDSKINDILSKRKSLLRFFVIPWVIGCLAGWNFKFIMTLLFVRKMILQPLMIILAFILWWTCGMHLEFRQHSLIYLKDSQGFLERNKDQLIVGLILAIFAVLFALLFK